MSQINLHQSYESHSHPLWPDGSNFSPKLNTKQVKTWIFTSCQYTLVSRYIKTSFLFVGVNSLSVFDVNLLTKTSNNSGKYLSETTFYPVNADYLATQMFR